MLTLIELVHRSLLIAIISLPLCVGGQTPPPLLQRPLEVTDTVEVTSKDTWKVALSHPTPHYPVEARRRHLTGKGFYHLNVAVDTGEVTSVDVLTSTGHRMLDDAAVATLKKWKFRPHTVIGVKVPIEFSMRTPATPNKTKSGI